MKKLLTSRVRTIEVHPDLLRYRGRSVYRRDPQYTESDWDAQAAEPRVSSSLGYQIYYARRVDQAVPGRSLSCSGRQIHTQSYVSGRGSGSQGRRDEHSFTLGQRGRGSVMIDCIGAFQAEWR